MIVYRLVHELTLPGHAPFEPARTDNRWNSDRTVVAYASESLALAAMEMLTYWGRYANLNGYLIYTYDLGEATVEDQLEHDPKLDVLDKATTQRHGDRWALEQRSLALRVPSIVLPLSSNFLINPAHPDFDADRVEPKGRFRFDERIEKLILAAKNTVH